MTRLASFDLHDHLRRRKGLTSAPCCRWASWSSGKGIVAPEGAHLALAPQASAPADLWASRDQGPPSQSHLFPLFSLCPCFCLPLPFLSFHPLFSSISVSVPCLPSPRPMPSRALGPEKERTPWDSCLTLCLGLSPKTGSQKTRPACWELPGDLGGAARPHDFSKDASSPGRGDTGGS